jgi:hypothetical protein
MKQSHVGQQTADDADPQQRLLVLAVRPILQFLSDEAKGAHVAQYSAIQWVGQ